MPAVNPFGIFHKPVFNPFGLFHLLSTRLVFFSSCQPVWYFLPAVNPLGIFHKSENPFTIWYPLTNHTIEKEKKRERCCSFEQIYRTMGLISADRSNKATLLLTIPRSIKVVCNGFISSNI